MSWDFNGSSQYGRCTTLEFDSGADFTCAIWFKVATGTTPTGVSCLGGSARSTSFERGYTAVIRGDQTGDPLALKSATGSTTYLDGTSFSEASWNVVIFSRATGAGSQAAVIQLNADTETSGSAADSGSTPDNLIVAASWASAAASQYFDGLIGGMAVWSSVLSGTDMDSLGSGTDPTTVSSGTLVEFWDFAADTGSTSTGVNSNVFTWTGTPTFSSDSPFSSVDTLSPPLISAGTTLYAPSVASTVSAPLIAAATALYAPITAERVTLVTPSFTSESVLYGYTGDTPVAGDHIEWYEATPGNSDIDDTGALTQASPSAVVVRIVDVSDTTSDWYVFELADLSIPTISGQTMFFSPTISEGDVLAVPLLDASPTLYAAQLNSTIYHPASDFSGSLYTPSLVATISAGVIDGTVLYAPSVAGAATLDAPFISAATSLYAPEVASVITVPLLEASATLQVPSVTFRDYLSPPLIASGLSLYAPLLYRSGNAGSFYRPATIPANNPNSGGGFYNS